MAGVINYAILMQILVIGGSPSSSSLQIGIISSVYSQSDLLPKEIYLFEKIDTVLSKEPISFMKCVCLLRPTKENVNLLCNELRNPKFGQYHVCFTNTIGREEVRRLAESDKNEVIKSIKEYYIDYCAINPHFFSLNIRTSCYLGSSNVWDHSAFNRTVSGLLAFLKSVKKNPTIRYQSSSEMCKRLAEGIKRASNEGDLLPNNQTKLDSSFVNKSTPPVLLIIDRKSDGFTPLLNQVSFNSKLTLLDCLTVSIIVLTMPKLFAVVLPGDDSRTDGHQQQQGESEKSEGSSQIQGVHVVVRTGCILSREHVSELQRDRDQHQDQHGRA